MPPDAIRARRWFAFCGIAGPEGFVRQLASLGGTCAGERFFPDHHAYTPRDLADLLAECKRSGADVLITTEKDWVKLAPLARPADLPPIWHLDVQIRFEGDDERKMLARVLEVVSARRS